MKPDDLHMIKVPIESKDPIRAATVALQMWHEARNEYIVADKARMRAEDMMRAAKDGFIERYSEILREAGLDEAAVKEAAENAFKRERDR